MFVRAKNFSMKINTRSIVSLLFNYVLRPLTAGRWIVPSTGVISDGFETFEYIFPRPMNGLT